MIQFFRVALDCMNKFDISMLNLSQEMSGFKPFGIQCIRCLDSSLETAEFPRSCYQPQFRIIL